MATNLYFNNFNAFNEQTLIEDLIIESIKIYGIDVQYMPRTLVKEDLLFGEDVLSQFNKAITLEMYVKNVDGFDGDGDFLSKFGLEIRDEMTLTVAVRRFNEETRQENTTKQIGRPAEGDLILFPLNNKLFEVKFVEHESIFYQMGELQIYDLRVELFQYSHEQFNTGIKNIDAIEDTYSSDKSFYQLTDEAGNVMVFEDGAAMVQEGWRLEDTDNSANNEYFTTQTTDPTLNFVDWSESNPFGDL